MSSSTNTSVIHPWESMSPQDIDKLSPATMRETNADYFFHELYRTASNIDVYGWQADLTPDALVRFGRLTSVAPGMPYPYRFLRFEQNQYCYQNGMVYIWNPYKMLPYRRIPVMHFTPEQDTVFRHAVQALIAQYKNRYYLFSEAIKMKETQPQKYPQVIQCFNLSVKHYLENNPLQKPVRCDGCERKCYMSIQEHTNPLGWGVDKYPTTNHIFAHDRHDKCADKMQEYLNKIKQNTR